MTERVLGPTGSPRRRWTLLLPLVVMIALGLFYVAGAQAVHDETFQLDGNVVAGPRDQPRGQYAERSTGTACSTRTATDEDVAADRLRRDANFDKDFTNNGTSYVNE